MLLSYLLIVNKTLLRELRNTLYMYVLIFTMNELTSLLLSFLSLHIYSKL
jgi:hypothetical protein